MTTCKTGHGPDTGEVRPRVYDPIERAKRNPKSLRAAIDAMCWDCQGRGVDPGTRWRIGNCEITACPLYPVRPYQQRHGTPPQRRRQEEEAENAMLACIKAEEQNFPTKNAILKGLRSWSKVPGMTRALAESAIERLLHHGRVVEEELPRERRQGSRKTWLRAIDATGNPTGPEPKMGAGE